MGFKTRCVGAKGYAHRSIMLGQAIGQGHMKRIATMGLHQAWHCQIKIAGAPREQTLDRHGLRQNATFFFLAGIPSGHPPQSWL